MIIISAQQIARWQMRGGNPCTDVIFHHQQPSFIPQALIWLRWYDNMTKMMKMMMTNMTTYSMFGCLVDGSSHQATALHLTTLNIPPTLMEHHDAFLMMMRIMMMACLFVTKVTQVMTSTTSWPQSTCPPNHLRLFKALDLMSWEVKFVCSFSLPQLKKFISDHYDGSLDDDDVYQGCYQG